MIETGTAGAHGPTVFQRRGNTLDALGRYLREGVRIGVGPHTYPHNTPEELRTGDIFAAATPGGGALLQPQRDDIGPPTPGAETDLVAVDHAAAAPAVTEAQRRAEAPVPERDRAGRDHWTIAEPVPPFAEVGRG
jgi:cytosine/adenosine deaminase-related metal-dependent hydrolase